MPVEVSMLYLYDRTGKHIYTMDDARGLTIGRSDENMLVLHDECVSSKHAAIYFRNGRYYLQDLNSKNGTCMGAQKISHIELRDGCGFVCGNMQLFVRITAAAAKAEAAVGQQAPIRPALRTPQKKRTAPALLAVIAFLSVLLLAGGAFLILRPKRGPMDSYRYQGLNRLSKDNAWGGQNPFQGKGSRYPGQYLGNGSVPGGSAGNNSNYSGASGDRNTARDAANFGKSTYDIVKEGYKMQQDPVGTAQRMTEDDAYTDDMENKVNNYLDSADKLNDDIEKASEKAEKTLNKLFGD